MFYYYLPDKSFKLCKPGQKRHKLSLFPGFQASHELFWIRTSAEKTVTRMFNIEKQGIHLHLYPKLWDIKYVDEVFLTFLSTVLSFGSVAAVKYR